MCSAKVPPYSMSIAAPAYHLQLPPNFLLSLSELQQPLIEPSHGLQESLFLSKFLNWHTQITSNGKTMGNTAVKVDLVCVFDLSENLLGKVSLLDGENFVGFGCCDREGAFYRAKFVFFHESRFHS
ncbi:hypothetical protein ACMFMG_005373 [Clarireedia jacksonii]